MTRARPHCGPHCGQEVKGLPGRAQRGFASRVLCSWLGGAQIHLILDHCSSGRPSDITSTFLGLLQEEAKQDEGLLPVALPEKGGGCQVGRREHPASASSGNFGESNHGTLDFGTRADSWAEVQ